MIRWIPTTTLILLCAGAAGLVAREAASRPPQPTAAVEEPIVADEEEPLEEEPSAEGDTAEVQELLTPPESDVPLERQGGFHVMADGSPVPPLPGDAPTKLKLGVALFRYAGVQGAGSTSRTRAEAFALAQKALALPTFQESVSTADPGSSLDIGWIRRGVLERSVEYAVFSLAKGDTAPVPIDTPRGYWVAKRVR